MKKEDILEIDIFMLLKRIWKKKIIIILTALIFAISTFVYSRLIVEEKYISTTKIYVLNSNNNNNVTIQDIQIGTNLLKDYREIILSNDVLSKVIEENKLNITKSQLKDKITLDSPKDTRIISISVEDLDPEKANNILISLRSAAIEKIKDITKIDDITIIEKATATLKGDNTKKYVAIAFVLGIVISSLIVILKEIIDDKIKSPEDLEERNDIILLGIIPKRIEE